MPRLRERPRPPAPEGCPFQERDITADQASLVEFRALGLPATPVTVIGGRPVLGYDRRALETLISMLG